MSCKFDTTISTHYIYTRSKRKRSALMCLQTQHIDTVTSTHYKVKEKNPHEDHIAGNFHEYKDLTPERNFRVIFNFAIVWHGALKLYTCLQRWQSV